MPDYLETTVDKFIFRVAKDRYYIPEGLWALAEEGSIRIGLSDFVQQRNGDVAFAELQPEGTELAVGDEVAVIETIKVDISFPSPVSGVITRVNPAMVTEPEIINRDPYGEGWLAVIEANDWNADLANLLSPEAYFEIMKRTAEEEASSS